MKLLVNNSTDPAFNLALEELIASEYPEEAVMLWRNAPAIIVGRNQNTEAEINAEAILLAKKVDAVYDSDPNVNPDAKKFDSLSFIEVLNRGLGVMDSTATSLCMDNNMPIHVFGLDDTDNIVRAACGEKLGTIVSNQ